MSIELTEEEKQVLRKISSAHLQKGIRKRRFRRPKKWTISNRILYGLMYVHDIKCADLAEMLSVSERRVNAWVFEGEMPNQENKMKICRIFDMPEHILFNEHDIKKQLKDHG